VTRVVLLTDFGTADGYAAAMAGVVASAAPEAVVEHASHEIGPGDILAGAFALSRYAHLYPPGTVHLVVVDPGVGTQRRAIAATVDGRHFVGPDNGLFTCVLEGARRARIVAIHESGRGPDASPTFHGRDIFAPAAAFLARGGALEDLGPSVVDPHILEVPRPERLADSVRGEVLQVDRFGSLVTNIPASWIREMGGAVGAVHVWLDGADMGPIRRTYGDVPTGDVVALLGSRDLLEISVRDGNAAARLGADRGAAVEVRPV
jgi:S-adenosyl-L-methionine hydrolase (adenosine-forming)